MPEHVLIDTDPGIDDAMALLLALQSPELEIAAITTVSGNVSVDTATRNVFTILSLLSPPVRPPVAKGASRPREKDPIHAAHIHGNDGLGRLDRFRDSIGRLRSIPVGNTRSLKPALKKPPNAEVCVGVDAQRFVSFFLVRGVCPRSS